MAIGIEKIYSEQVRWSVIRDPAVALLVPYFLGTVNHSDSTGLIDSRGTREPSSIYTQVYIYVYIYFFQEMSGRRGGGDRQGAVQFSPLGELSRCRCRRRPFSPGRRRTSERGSENAIVHHFGRRLAVRITDENTHGSSEP